MASRLPSFALPMAYAFIACMLLPACERHLSDQNLNCVKMDMSPKEVESILGQPTRQETREMELQEDVKTLPGQRYIYEQNGKTVVLHFFNGKLIGQDGSFDK